MNAINKLFEEFVKGGAPYLHQLKAEGTTESYFLEFKKLYRDGLPLNDDDKKNLAKTISAFANSDGGVLVWGVSAGGNKEDPEAITGLNPIKDLSMVESKLESLCYQLVLPTVQGIILKRIEQSENEGYIAMLIPKVDEGEPIMAMGPNQRCYYARVGTTSQRMEHSQVSRLFARKPSPKLELIYRVERFFDIGWFIIFGVKNTGKAIAKLPAAIFHESPSFDTNKLEQHSLGQPWGAWALGFPNAHTNSRILQSGIEHCIHIGVVTEIAKYSNTAVQAGLDNIEIDHELFCEGFYERGRTIIPVKETWVKAGFNKSLEEHDRSTLTSFEATPRSDTASFKPGINGTST